MTPALPRWADIPITKTGISPSQVKARPPASIALALDVAELFRHITSVRCGFMGERRSKEERSQAEGLKHCSLHCVSHGRGMSSPCPTQKPQTAGECWPGGCIAYLQQGTDWLQTEKMVVPPAASGVLPFILFACFIFCKAELFWFLTLVRKVQQRKSKLSSV